MSIAAIPGFSVQKAGRNKYVVSNGQESAVLNKKELKTFSKVYGVKDNSKSKTVMIASAVGAAVGAAVAGVVYRKNIGQFLEKAFKNFDLKETFNTVKNKSTEVVSNSKKKVSEFINKKNIKLNTEKFKANLQDLTSKTVNKTEKWYNKVADFVSSVFGKIKNFFKGLFGKKEAVQQELPFPKESNGLIKSFDKFNKKIVKNYNKVCKFFGNLLKHPEEKVSAESLRKQVLKNSGDDVVKAFERDNSATWLKTFKKRYPESDVVLASRK